MTRFAIIACYGSHGRDRTCDKWINSPLLLPLSYARKMKHSKSKKFLIHQKFQCKVWGSNPRMRTQQILSLPPQTSRATLRENITILFFFKTNMIYTLPDCRPRCRCRCCPPKACKSVNLSLLQDNFFKMPNLDMNHEK